MNSLPSNNSWIGRLIGDNQRYRLDKRLGGGGMGEVFLATDTRIGKNVALKLLKDKLVASGEMRKRFEREIEICAALQSDHIIEISDCGVTIEGYPFYVMEYLRGQTLRQLLMRERQLSPERTVKIMTQVCKGLQLAHRGIVMQRDGKNTDRIKVIHRDLKPDNIFLVPTDFGEWVKILDFGIAKIYNESSEQTHLTKTFIGTFRYSSPEQIQNNRNIDVSADIYSLGIILYEMLSAADPFGLSIQGNNISEPSWLLAHSYEPPRPLRAQPGCEQLSLELEAVVIKCLQKNPINRFQSAQELAQALEAAIKPVTKTTINKSTTIVQPRPQQSPSGSNYETAARPIQASNDETVHRPVQLPPQNKSQQGSNDITINRPLQPPQNIFQQGSNEETINKPLHPSQQNSKLFDDETVDKPLQVPQTQIFQPPQPQSVPEPGIKTPEATIMQTRPATNSGSKQPVNIDNTIMQQSPGAANDPTPENTIFQPKPENTIFQPKSENTIFQPKSENRIFQPKPENRIFQPKPENTIFQTKPANYQPVQQAPEDTIYQPRKNKPISQNSSNTLKIIAIASALALTLGLISYFITSRLNKNDNNRRAPTSVLPYINSTS
ncbi:MAG: protein kinase [Calothrix sp. FI2-JRJ7]|jgi:serine/threonine-protein kinase|nr:protein kinase [Calothrix sp. FI2-JRJ7]